MILDEHKDSIKEKLDQLDKKILRKLLTNSREPSATIAKSIGSSREVVEYRIKRMEREGIIRSWTTEINYQLFGFESAVLFFKIRSRSETRAIETIKKHPFMSWLSTFAGKWSLGISIYGKSLFDINKIVSEFLTDLGEDLIDYRVWYHKAIYNNGEAFFGQRGIDTDHIYAQVELTETDKKILKALSENARATAVDIAIKLRIDAQTVRKKLNRLEKSHVIRRYSILIDYSKLHLYQYSIFLSNTDEKKRAQLIELIRSKPETIFAVSYLNDAHVESIIAISNPYDLKEILQEYEERVPGTQFVSIDFVHQDLISVRLPAGLFE